MSRQFLVADLFCGAGGSSTGAERAVRELDAESVPSVRVVPCVG